MIILDVFLVLCVIVAQVLLFRKAKENISLLEELLPGKVANKALPLKIERKIVDKESMEYVEGGIDDDVFDSFDEKYFEVDTIVASGNQRFSESFTEILHSTNSYLKNNKGTSADFTILREIAQRKCSAEENSLSSLIPVPLYLGLMGTFVGSGVGILSIIFSTGGKIEQNTIVEFLIGVAVAMVSSFLGLAFTTVNNTWHFRNAKNVLEMNLNNYLTFIQAELLPKLSSDMNNSFLTLKTNLDNFNEEFSKNIESFQGTIGSITTNIRLQKEFLEHIKNLDVNKIISSNIHFYQKFIENEGKFNEILEKLISHNDNLNTSMVKTLKATDSVSLVLDRFSNFETELQEFAESFKFILQKNDNTFEWFEKHLAAIEHRKQVVESYVVEADDDLKKYLDFEKEKIAAVVESLQVRFDEIFSVGQDKKFFDYLPKLDEIATNLNSLTSYIQGVSVDQNKGHYEGMLALLKKISEGSRTGGGSSSGGRSGSGSSTDYAKQIEALNSLGESLKVISSQVRFEPKNKGLFGRSKSE